jgi:hypothetical protein
MKETDKQHKKRCLVCKREFVEDENYCPDDGSVLEQARDSGDYPGQPLAPMTGDDANAVSKDVDTDSGMPLARIRFVAGRSRSRRSNGEKQQKQS